MSAAPVKKEEDGAPDYERAKPWMDREWKEPWALDEDVGPPAGEAGARDGQLEGTDPISEAAMRLVERAEKTAVKRRPDDPMELVAANYAAVDWGGGFGLIDTGLSSGGVRDLVAHAPRSRSVEKVNAVRPGQVIRLLGVGTRRAARMRVLFTTPARYYAPGTKVSSIRIGVDSKEWEGFLLGAPGDVELSSIKYKRPRKKARAE